MIRRVSDWLMISVLLMVGSNGLAQDANRAVDRLQQLLKKYPEADADKDGKLTEAEARSYAKGVKGSAKKKSKASETPTAQAFQPTMTDVAYGPHERNKLDFWQAKSETPAPLVVFIHGGGFVSGDKSKVNGDQLVQECLDQGVSFAAINYRYRTMAPIQDVLRDCARAIQFLRFKSSEWKLDPKRVACYGGSAGAGTSMWLAFHDDLADPNSLDPVLRQSTRISCAGSSAGQFSYDVVRWLDVFGEEAAEKFSRPDEAIQFYGLKTRDELDSEVGKKHRADCDMYGLISKEDPPVFLACSRSAGEIKDRGAYLHHPKHSQLVYDRCRECGIDAVADLPGLNIKPPSDGPATLRDFLFAHLQVESN